MLETKSVAWMGEMHILAGSTRSLKPSPASHSLLPSISTEMGQV